MQENKKVMAILQSVSKFGSRIVPTSKGIIQNAVTGIGADSVIRTIDNVVGSPLQKTFSVNLPIIGSIGAVEAMNYVFHAGGFKISKKGLFAVLSAKIASGAVTNLAGIRLPSITGMQSTQSAPSATGLSGGLPI